MSSSYLIIMIVVMFALMYFMVMRPQRKQMEKQREMLNQMSEGTRVMLTSGLFGTVRATGDKQAVIELAPGVDITVLKQAISRIVKPEDEEFEFADDIAEDQAATADEPVVENDAEAAADVEPVSSAGEPAGEAENSGAEQDGPGEADVTEDTADEDAVEEVPDEAAVAGDDKN
ncbi:preprotein translocase subunit YajC [Propionibacterium australiense]|nr:preprotein translocase subunit YajC [Propionibacterium australiense]SYZ32209.1 yajC: preprotein translocase, YajC subunit [Propionibacterium australiense]VEH90671.1 preprotein translocase subunit YajC [Propionibacterium australiense]